MFHHTSFVKSCSDWRQWPEISTSTPIVGFWGRSNVGKSSLLNALLGEKIAHVSKTPGRTQLLNLFFHPAKPNKGPDCLFCDLPGYGYANLSKKDAGAISDRLYDYIENSPFAPNLLLWLLDARHGCTATDFAILPLIAGLQENSDVIIITTKNDKLSKNEQIKNHQFLKKQMLQLGITAEILPWSTLDHRAEHLQCIEQKILDFCQNFIAERTNTAS